jgi:hypothetical protein
MEVWKDVIGYEEMYQISNLGRVKSLNRLVSQKNGVKKKIKERVLKPCDNGKGYLFVILRKDDYSKQRTLHQMVAESFLNHKTKDYKLVVDHKNGIRQDNRLENLQLITQRNNTSKDKKNKTSKYIGVCWNKNINKWMSAIRIDGKKNHLGYFKCELAAAVAYQNKLKDVC